jgi:hypothetical protein
MTARAVVSRLARALSGPRASLYIIGVALVLVLPCINVGFAADDYVQYVAAVDEASVPSFERGPLDLYTFSSGSAEEVRALRDHGIFGWWVADDLQLSFFRPLSSATHALDYALWPGAPWAMYLHSIAWFAALLFAARAFYRSMHETEGGRGGWIAALALLLYGLDDGRGPVVGWISNRNALVMGAFSFACLWAYHRRRIRGDVGAWVAPTCLALALASAEGAVATVGYLGSYLVFMDDAPWRDRLRRLSPCLAVFAVWAVIYRVGGWGASGSGVYLDPGGELGAFIRHAPARIVVLLVGQLATPWSDFWPAYPPHVAPFMLGAAVSTLLVIAVLVWPTVRASAAARFYGAGMVLSVLPLAATFPADRLLTMVSVGGAGLLAATFAHWKEHGAGAKWRTVGLVALLGYHGVVAPLLLPIRVRSMAGVQRSLDVFDRAVPSGPEIAAETVVVVHSPSDGLVGYLPFIRAAKGTPSPRELRLLVGTLHAVEVTREDVATLLIRPEGGFLADMSNRMQRGPSRPFQRGQVIELPDLRVTVTELTDDGRPAEARFEFDGPLERPGLMWRRWVVDEYRPWRPPAIGETERFEAVDLAALASLLTQ